MAKAPKDDKTEQSAANTGISPAASGPAGPHFEGQVGASYLLCMLAGSEPRGMPGTSIDRVEFQRADDGHPLDDVIVHAHDSEGNAAVLEIQVKRSITFTPSDAIFKKVVCQIVETSKQSGFWTRRHELAIATTSNSKKISGAYQDVLRWAREIGSPSVFMNRIKRKGSANPDMRSFVNTFKSNLRDAGGVDDDEITWKLLRRLQILIFDFTSAGSASEDLAKERAARVLHPDQISRAGDFWRNLIEFAINTDKDAGDRDLAGLMKDLDQQNYRLSGTPRTASVRTAIAEASRHSLDDIQDRVGDVLLTRHEIISEVRASLDGDKHYVEIRGDAGVGKSGLMKHFAELAATEGTVFVLTPDRTIPQGWTAMRGSLGFQGTARELLTDLAVDGGVTLFIDNLDQFEEERRITVRDLVREAVNVPNIAVIATVRTRFGVDEPNWLPKEALDQLGQAAPILVRELSETEVNELRHADSTLAALLAKGHPAEGMVRNLFRLSRLVERSVSEPVPRTETDMAEQWWRTADGKKEADGKHRERFRVLKELAGKALEGDTSFDVSKLPPDAVEALIRSETLRELTPDRVTFQHDVLREWAISGLLSSDAQMLVRLPLDGPATAVLGRSVELVARQTLERDHSNWAPLLKQLSGDGVHGSWRRVALLALVRSEMGVELLDRESDVLLTQEAELLRELIRTVLAVEVEPASTLYTAAGIDPALIPANLKVPSAPSYYRLVRWLAGLGEDLPPAAIPEVVRLYTTFVAATLGYDSFTPVIVSWFYRWLMEIEDADSADIRENRTPFGGGLAPEKIGTLKSELRIGFLSLCHRKPDLAASYLKTLATRSRNYRDCQNVVMSCGTLAQAAPTELAELTARALISSPHSDDFWGKRDHEAFDFFDHEFLPLSPSKGPFLQLLTHAPQHGLDLIRRLVDHAVSFRSGGRPHGANALTIVFPSQERVFPWAETYRWSREGVGNYAVTCALMALELWAHRRIEAGEEFSVVLSDVIGPTGVPAAYLLVAVDLILSHWPASRESAIPFLGCPELLSMDRLRAAQEGFGGADLFNLNQDSLGAKNLEDLRQRPSRRTQLEYALSNYALFEPFSQRDILTDLLRNAAARLHPPGKDADFADPEFMVLHALNRVDPENYVKEERVMPDGTKAEGWRYISPPEEAKHLAFLQDASLGVISDVNTPIVIGNAVDDPSRSSAQFAVEVVKWAQGSDATRKTDDPDGEWIREEAVISSAMIAMRDGDADLRAKHRDWARDIFTRALKSEKDPVHRLREGLRYNTVAIAFAGLIFMLREQSGPDELRSIMEIAAGENPGVAHGFVAAAAALANLDERLPRAVLRCAFSACVRPRRRWDTDEDEAEKLSERARILAKSTVDSEMAWLAGSEPEPTWPIFVDTKPRPRPSLRLPGGGAEIDQPSDKPSQEEEYTDHQAAALWLNACAGLADVSKRPWLRDLVRAYSQWTKTANGAELGADVEVDRQPSEWNFAYFDLLAKCLPGASSTDVDELALSPIASLPDDAFCDVVVIFLRTVDEIYFEGNIIATSEAVRIRSTLARRLCESRKWQRLTASHSTSVEMHTGPAVAVFFFNNYQSFSTLPPKSYLLEMGIDQLGPFLPVIEALILTAPCPFVAILTLDLFEVSPRREHLSLLLAGAKAWLGHMPENTEFWIDHGAGRRFCALVSAIRQQESAMFIAGTPHRRDLDFLLAALVRIGVSEASELEVNLGKMPG